MKKSKLFGIASLALAVILVLPTSLNCFSVSGASYQAVNSQEEIEELYRELDAYRKKIDTQKENILMETNLQFYQIEAKLRNYEKDLSDIQKEISNIQGRLITLQFDDSAIAQKERNELNEELKEKTDELEELQSLKGIKQQIDALDAEYERFDSLQRAKIELISQSARKTEEPISTPSLAPKPTPTLEPMPLPIPEPMPDTTLAPMPADENKSNQNIIFNDIETTDWYANAVQYMAGVGIIKGDGVNFKPDDNVTRADFLIIVMRAYEVELNTDLSDNFADVEAHAYYEQYLATAKQLELVGGTGNGNYSPDESISRQDMFVILYNILRKTNELPTKENTDATYFSDYGIVSDYAKEPIDYFVASNIVRGSENKLTPQETSTRAEAAQLLYNLLTL